MPFISHFHGCFPQCSEPTRLGCSIALSGFWFASEQPTLRLNWAPLAGPGTQERQAVNRAAAHSHGTSFPIPLSAGASYLLDEKHLVCLFGATRSGAQELLLLVHEFQSFKWGPGDQTVHSGEAHYSIASALDGKH